LKKFCLDKPYVIDSIIEYPEAIGLYKPADSFAALPLLPKELLCSVFSYLEPRQLINAARSARAWKEAAYGNELWKRLTASRWPTVNTLMPVPDWRLYFAKRFESRLKLLLVSILLLIFKPIVSSLSPQERIVPPSSSTTDPNQWWILALSSLNAP